MVSKPVRYLYEEYNNNHRGEVEEEDVYVLKMLTALKQRDTWSHSDEAKAATMQSQN